MRDKDRDWEKVEVTTWTGYDSPVAICPVCEAGLQGKACKQVEMKFVAGDWFCPECNCRGETDWSDERNGTVTWVWYTVDRFDREWPDGEVDNGWWEPEGNLAEAEEE